jgi:holo-[acyl-carrier protein] synthase
MKMSHIGIDIIEIDRIRKAISRWESHFLDRIFTAEELLLYQGRIESLAARFAAKEAAIKALSSTGASIGWKDIEILSESNGKPFVRLSRQAQIQARQLGLCGLEVSLSHSKENAIALVIGVGED